MTVTGLETIVGQMMLMMMTMMTMLTHVMVVLEVKGTTVGPVMKRRMRMTRTTRRRMKMSGSVGRS